MTDAPIEERNARLVLDIYCHFGSKPGDTLITNDFIPIAARKSMKVSDLRAGLDDAVRLRWLEETPSGALRLTPLGFEQMRASLTLGAT